MERFLSTKCMYECRWVKNVFLEPSIGRGLIHAAKACAGSDSQHSVLGHSLGLTVPYCAAMTDSMAKIVR